MGANPLVSVVMRTVPGNHLLLWEAIASVIRQDYRPIEVVVVEDGGSSMRAPMNGLSEDGVDFVYIEAKKVGRCKAGNIGLAAARGRYLCFLDDDDVFLRRHLSTLVPRLEAAPKAPVGYCASFISYCTIRNRDPLVIDEMRRELFGRTNFSLSLLWREPIFPIQAAVFRRELLEKHGGLHAELDALEDWDLWLRYAAEGDFLYVDRATSRFRMPADPAVREERAFYHRQHMTFIERRKKELLQTYRRLRHRGGSRVLVSILTGDSPSRG